MTKNQHFNNAGTKKQTNKQKTANQSFELNKK